jgi:hypothetical protein
MKTSNGYARALKPGVYEKIPKAVFAALAVSFATMGGDFLDEARGMENSSSKRNRSAKTVRG